jgi:hypothetical protein
MDVPSDIMAAAEDIAGELQRHRIDAVIIGAVALAAYNYVRQTDDVDMGFNATITAMRELASALRARGYEVELREPDAQDPLGGVLDITGPFGVVQLINYADRFPIVIDDALREATLVTRTGSSLKIVPIPQLVALKLYAGGFKSKTDIIELLVRNPEADLKQIDAVCQCYRVQGFRELMPEIERLR